MEPGTPTPVVITAFSDRTFSFITKTPPNTYFLLKAAKIEKGSTTPGKGANVGRVTKTQLREIAAVKMKDMNANDVEAAVRMLAGRPARWALPWWRAEPWPSRASASRRSTPASTATGGMPLVEAIGLAKANAKAKFDETIEISMNLGIDPRHADQMVRGVVGLPNGTGKTVRVGVFARGAKAEEALAAGADVVGADDLAAAVQEGKIEFDRCIATPDMMGLVGRLGKILGPRGLMPNPRLGTVTMDVRAR